MHVTILYEEVKDEITQTSEDLIYMPVANEGSVIEVPVTENTVMQVTSIETVDLTDEETIRIHNREAEYYMKTGGHQGVIFLTIGTQELFLLVDDFVRLKNKNLIVVEEEKTMQKAV